MTAPRATSLLRNDLVNIEIRVSSDHSTKFAEDLVHGRLDVAFLRAEQFADIEIKVVARKPLMASRPPSGDVATIDFAVGCHGASTSPIVKRFLSRIDKLVA